MMYMPDAIRATIELMEANPGKVKIRSSYNVAAMSFSPAELAKEIQSQLRDLPAPTNPTSVNSMLTAGRRASTTAKREKTGDGSRNTISVK
jgi:hypothetical protein